MNRNTLCTAVCLLLATCTAIGQNLSYTIEPVSGGNNLRSVWLTDKNTGFLSGYYGDLMRSNDGGASWEMLDSLTYFPLYDLNFPNKDVGYAVGGASNSAICNPLPCTPKILKTSDGGDSWVELPFPNTSARELYSVWFINEQVGWVAGLGMLYQTTDGGNSWIAKTLSPANQNIQHIQFLDAQQGYYSGLFGRMYRTDDGGTTWSSLNTGVNSHLYCFDFADQNTGYAAGQGAMLKTTDGGQSWTVLSNAPIEVYGLQCVGAQLVVACGRGKTVPPGISYGMLAWSWDGGANWNINDTIPTGLLHDLHFPAAGLGVAVGYNQIVKISTGLSDLEGPKTLQKPHYRIFPNPTADECRIEIPGYLPAGLLRLDLFNVQGNILTLGADSDAVFRLETAPLPAGIYFFRVWDGERPLIEGKLVKI